jgi:ribosomal protein S18 acetylase RimI-like enzyme
MITFQDLQAAQIDEVVLMMEDFYAIDNYPIDREVSKKLFEEFITNEHLGKSWIIYHNDQIIGYTIITYIFSFEYKGLMAFLDELYIKESHRNRGFGSQTVQFIIHEVSRRNLKLIVLEVENHNLNAQKVYIDNDFEIHNRKIMKYFVNKNKKL